MNCETLIAQLDMIQNKGSSMVEAERDKPAPVLVASANKYDALYAAIRALTGSEEKALITILNEGDFKSIPSSAEFGVRIHGLMESDRPAVIMSRNMAKQLVGYQTHEETVGSIRYTVYQPVEGTSGPVFRIPHTDAQGAPLVDTFATLLVFIAADIACDFGIADRIVNDVDMQKYRADSAIGGKMRPCSVISADSNGVISYTDDKSIIAVYDLTGATMMNLSNGMGFKQYPLTGPILQHFKASSLIVDPNGPVNMGNGVRATGPLDPSSFQGGVPDQTDETRHQVAESINVNRTAFLKRYDAIVVEPRSAQQSIVAKSSASMAKLEDIQGMMFLPPPGYGTTLPRGGVNKTISAACDYVYSGEAVPEVRQQESNPLQVSARNNLADEAVSALFWLSSTTGKQMPTLDTRYPQVHQFAQAAVKSVGFGSCRSSLMAFIRTISRTQPLSFRQAAERAAQQGLLPPLQLQDDNGPFEVSHIVTFVLYLLKICASLKLTGRPGLDAKFYFEQKA
jgi:hypothetical protein